MELESMIKAFHNNFHYSKFYDEPIRDGILSFDSYSYSEILHVGQRKVFDQF